MKLGQHVSRQQRGQRVSRWASAHGVVRIASLCAMAWLVSACGSVAPDRFYTLAGMMPNGTSQASTSQVAPAGFYIELMPVDVPPQVSRAQLVVATGPAQVELLEHERWSAPLSDEVGRSLSDNLTRLLGAINVYRTPYPATSPVFRISVNLQRFESAPGRHAGMDATWSVRLLPDGEPVTCRSSIDEPVAAAGYDALVAGHRRALLRLSADIAGVVRTLAQHRAATTAADQRVRVGTGTGMGSSAPMPALWCPAAG